MIRYAKPKTVEEALGLLAGDRWRMLAGGTDFYPSQGSKPLRDNVLDLNSLSELRTRSETETHIVFGARTTWTDIVRATPPPAFDALKQAAREVGSVQIQNAGTIAGNLCNASPAADGVPPFLVLDAELELRSTGGKRLLPLEKFILGNRKTALAPDELLTAIHIPKHSTTGVSAFQKLGARRYLVISIAMVAARLELGRDGVIERAAIAVGSCSVVATRLPALEQALVGRMPGADVRETIRSIDIPELKPIEDVRGTAEYRLEAAREIIERTVLAAVGPVGRQARPA